MASFGKTRKTRAINDRTITDRAVRLRRKMPFTLMRKETTGLRWRKEKHAGGSACAKKSARGKAEKTALFYPPAIYFQKMQRAREGKKIVIEDSPATNDRKKRSLLVSTAEESSEGGREIGGHGRWEHLGSLGEGLFIPPAGFLGGGKGSEDRGKGLWKKKRQGVEAKGETGKATLYKKSGMGWGNRGCPGGEKTLGKENRKKERIREKTTGRKKWKRFRRLSSHFQIVGGRRKGRK